MAKRVAMKARKKWSIVPAPPHADLEICFASRRAAQRYKKAWGGVGRIERVLITPLKAKS